ncbi:hypothetical protein HGRIS_013632 [Hohenbuehelia grisea]|uniref:Uncharacterized protein n=1 Tax=Hohenbuehelia grisea TaxID=104357 RepID=A0ABR3IW28_9AGAR
MNPSPRDVIIAGVLDEHDPTLAPAREQDVTNIHALHDRILPRFWPGDFALVDLSNGRFEGCVAAVYTRVHCDTDERLMWTTCNQPHIVGLDLNLSLEASFAQDDPRDYLYSVNISSGSNILRPNIMVRACRLSRQSDSLKEAIIQRLREF